MIRLLHLYPRLALTFGALLIPMAFVCASAYADGAPVRVRGSVVSLDGSKLVVHANMVAPVGEFGSALAAARTAR